MTNAEKIARCLLLAVWFYAVVIRHYVKKYRWNKRQEMYRRMSERKCKGIILVKDDNGKTINIKIDA